MGTELSPEMAEAARREQGVEVLAGVREPLPFPDGHFDVVTSWHSLEHLPEPARALREAARLLRPGGILAVELPNADSLQARLGGSRWFHLDVPRHLYHFGRRDLAGLLEELGFAVVEEGTLSLEQGPFGMVQSLLNRATRTPNTLYGLLRRSGCRSAPGEPARGGKSLAAWDLLLTLLLAVPAAVAGTLLEGAACILGRGGVVRLLVVKRGPPGSPRPGS